VISSLAVAYYHLNEVEKANLPVKELITKAEESSVGSPSFYSALIYAQMEEIVASFEWLEKAYQDREVEMYWLKVEPPFEPLHRSPSVSRC